VAAALAPDPTGRHRAPTQPPPPPSAAFAPRATRRTRPSIDVVELPGVASHALDARLDAVMTEAIDAFLADVVESAVAGAAYDVDDDDGPDGGEPDALLSAELIADADVVEEGAAGPGEETEEVAVAEFADSAFAMHFAAASPVAAAAAFVAGD